MSRAGPMRLHTGEPGAVSCGMPAIWIYSDTDSANCSQRNLVDSKNDKVEFIRSRFMCSAGDENCTNSSMSSVNRRSLLAQGHAT